MQGKCKNTSNMLKKKWFTNTMPRILSQGLLQKISPVKYEKKPNLKLQEDNRKHNKRLYHKRHHYTNL